MSIPAQVSLPSCSPSQVPSSPGALPCSEACGLVPGSLILFLGLLFPSLPTSNCLRTPGLVLPLPHHPQDTGQPHSGSWF